MKYSEELIKTLQIPEYKQLIESGHLKSLLAKFFYSALMNQIIHLLYQMYLQKKYTPTFWVIILMRNKKPTGHFSVSGNGFTENILSAKYFNTEEQANDALKYVHGPAGYDYDVAVLGLTE